MTTAARTIRAPRDEDASAVLDVIIADDLHEIGRPDVDLTDIVDWWGQPHHDKSRDGFLLEGEYGEATLGYAQIQDRNRVGEHQIELWVRDANDHDAFTRLMDAAEARAVEMADEHGHGKSKLSTWSVVGREPRATWIAGRGYEPVRRFYRMEIALTEAPQVEVPDGVTIEPVGEDESNKRIFHGLMSDSFVDHWGYARTDYETWLGRVAASPNLDWSLVWIVRVDGEPAAGLKMRLYDDIAWIDTVGVLEAFRGRGLAQLMLRHSFAVAMERGQPNVELGVDTENSTGAVRVYELVGMHVAFAHQEWAKVQLEPSSS